MKLLPAVPLTDEDRAVNFEFAVARRGCGWIAQLLCDSWDADRRDAELILTAQRMRRLGFTDRWIAVPSLITVDWHAAGGALE